MSHIIKWMNESPTRSRKRRVKRSRSRKRKSLRGGIIFRNKSSSVSPDELEELPPREKARVIARIAVREAQDRFDIQNEKFNRGEITRLQWLKARDANIAAQQEFYGDS